MFYLFLDIDGVLNKESQWKTPFYLDDECIEVFVKIYTSIKKKYSSVSLILCSTWRIGSTDGSQTPQLENLAKKLSEYHIKIDDTTPYTTTKSRQQEIDYYLRRHNASDYMIIDDDLSLFDEPKNINLLQPNYKTGLTKVDIKKAEKIIGGRRWLPF